MATHPLLWSGCHTGTAYTLVQTFLHSMIESMLQEVPWLDLDLGPMPDIQEFMKTLDFSHEVFSNLTLNPK